MKLCKEQKHVINTTRITLEVIKYVHTSEERKYNWIS